MVIIGVDPHERTHTASALEPGTHRVVATVQNAGNGAAGRGGAGEPTREPMIRSWAGMRIFVC